MIEISQLTVGYGSKTVINRLSFLAGPSQSPVVLVGRNGSGKSTLLKAILGEIPCQGKINCSSQANGIGWLPQNYQVSLSMPVFDFVRLGTVKRSGLFPGFHSQADEKVSQALTELQIEQLKNAQTDTLSGGEWQLVCLAQLMVQEADVWLLDEPTASLDIYYKSLVFNFLWKMARSGKTILVSTHDLPFLPKENGSILFFPSTSGLVPISETSVQEAVDQLMLVDQS